MVALSEAASDAAKSKGLLRGEGVGKQREGGRGTRKVVGVKEDFSKENVIANFNAR